MDLDDDVPAKKGGGGRAVPIAYLPTCEYAFAAKIFAGHPQPPHCHYEPLKNIIITKGDLNGRSVHGVFF